MSAIIYTSKTCAYCPIVKKFLNKYGIPFIEKSIEEPGIGEEAFKVSGATTVPVLFYKGQVEVGYNPRTLSQLLMS